MRQGAFAYARLSGGPKGEDRQIMQWPPRPSAKLQDRWNGCGSSGPCQHHEDDHQAGFEQWDAARNAAEGRSRTNRSQAAARAGGVAGKQIGEHGTGFYRLLHLDHLQQSLVTELVTTLITNAAPTASTWVIDAISGGPGTWISRLVIMDNATRSGGAKRCGSARFIEMREHWRFANVIRCLCGQIAIFFATVARIAWLPVSSAANWPKIDRKPPEAYHPACAVPVRAQRVEVPI